MAEQRHQDYRNHPHRPRLAAVAALTGAAAFVIFVVSAVRSPSALTLALVLLSVSVLTLVAISRVYTVRLQDRIIRLEMRLRLERLGRGGDFTRLAHQQIVALRFASDDELPDLLDRALTERLPAGAIKQAVRDWQADWYRT